MPVTVRVRIVGALVLLAILGLAQGRPATSALQQAVELLGFVLCLLCAGLCFRAAAGIRTASRGFWSVLGVASLLWAGGFAVSVAAPRAGALVSRVGPEDWFFGASTIAFVVACALRPDRPRAVLGVAFDVAILSVLVLHTWLYFAVADTLLGAEVPGSWVILLNDARTLLMLACAAWLIEGSRGRWRRTYLELGAALVVLFGGSSLSYRALAAGVYHPGLWDLPWTLPFLWIGLVAVDPELRAEAADSAAHRPRWVDLRRGAVVALAAIAFVPALSFISDFSGEYLAASAAGVGMQVARLRAGIGLATTLVVAGLVIARQLHLLRWAERVQVQREQALRESEERFSKAFSASPVAMSISTVGEGRYLDVNESYLRLMRRNRDEVLMRSSVELGFFQSPEERDALVRRLGQGEAVRGSPLVLRLASGERRDVLVSLEVVTLGSTPCLLGAVEDVTERRRADEALRVSERRYRLLFERNLAGFFRTTPAGRILECNESFVQMLGYPSREALLARSAAELYFDPADRDAEVRLLLERGALTNHEVRLRRVDGSPLWIVENEVLAPDDEGPGEVIEGTGIDITERKRAEDDVRRLARLKTNFLVVASHEMRTPLTVLAGYQDLLLASSDLGAQQRRSLEVCQRTVQRLSRTFEDILASLQITEGRLALRAAPLDLAEVARDVLEELTPFAERRGQTTRLEAAAALPRLPADCDRIHEVLSKLVENAIKFTPDGGEIAVAVDLQPGWHRIRVRDTGIGIAPHELDDVWERFYSGANPLHHSSGTYQFKARGSGLGLAIAKGYVEAHGGRISASSEGPDRGTTFTVLLPSDGPALPRGLVPE